MTTITVSFHVTTSQSLIAHLAGHGTFPESVLDTGCMFVAYYNNSDADFFLPANTRIGELSQ